MLMKVFCLLGFLLTSFVLHPIKLTTSSLKYNRQGNCLELKINFFMDDFSSHLGEVYQIPGLDFAKENKDELVLDYVRDAFQLIINDTLITRFVSIETEVLESNVIQARINSDSIPVDKIWKTEIANTLLFEAFPDEQVNLLYYHLITGNGPRFLRFSTNEGVKVLHESFTVR